MEDTQPPPEATGAPRAFRSIYDERFADVCRWLRAMGIPDSDREDVAQEVFLVVQRKLSAFDGRDLGAWLYRITSHTASDQRRRSWWKNLFGRRTSTPIEKHASTGIGPAHAFERAEDRRLVWRLMEGLSQKHRVVIALFEIEGYTLEEVASLVGIPEATVKTRLHYGRQRLLKLAEQELGPAGDGSRFGDGDGGRR